MVIEITLDTPPQGYIGPCSHTDCTNAAQHALIFTVDGTEAHTWVCNKHYRALEQLQEKTPADLATGGE